MVKSAAVADRDGKRHTNLVTVAGGGAHGDGQNGEHALQPACMGRWVGEMKWLALKGCCGFFQFQEATRDSRVSRVRKDRGGRVDLNLSLSVHIQRLSACNVYIFICLVSDRRQIHKSDRRSCSTRYTFTTQARSVLVRLRLGSV